MYRILASLLPAALLATVSPAAHAADSYDSCTGTITVLPAVIATQGVWCMKNDLATSITSGSAITVTANNVTIDCNHFKLGGLSAGAGTLTNGIASSKLNTTVRNCNVRGFFRGLYADGGGLLAEDNRFEGNTFIGVVAAGASDIVRRNEIIDTGGSSQATYAFGIVANSANAQVLDNSIAGLSGAGNVLPTAGIIVDGGAETLVRGNRITGLVPTGPGPLVGIEVRLSTLVVVDDNTGFGELADNGVACTSSDFILLRNNVMYGFADTVYGATCTDGGGNID